MNIHRSPRNRRTSGGFTIWHALIAIAILALVALLVAYCIKRGSGGITISSSISQEVQDISGPILAGASSQQVRDAAGKIARDVIQNSLNAGMSKEDIRKWCQEIRSKLNEAKAGLSNDEKAKYTAAQQAIESACQELVGH